MNVLMELPTESTILWQGGDDAEHERLREHAAALHAVVDKLKKQSRSGAALLGEVDPLAQAIADAEAADAEAAAFASAADERGVKVVLRAVDRKKWATLTAAHPPRDDQPKDEVFGGNIDTMPDDLVFASLASPPLADDERHEFLDSLSYGQFDRLAYLAWQVNKQRGLANPKAKRG